MISINKTKLIKVSAVLTLCALGVVGGIKGTEYIVEKESLEGAPVSAPADWGLSFQQEGQPPVGNATKEYLGQFDGYFVGGDDKAIYLTFDAGYENGYTNDILDILKEKEAPATFFCTGNYVRDNRDIIKRMAEEGHIVGNHTMTHPDMSAIESLEAFGQELSQVETLYADATGKEMPKFYRPPQGKFSEDNLKQAKSLGYKTIFWSLAYVDWYDDKQPTREEAFDKLVPRTHPGAIVLLHSTSKTNSIILGDLIDQWRDMGYEIKSIDQL